MKAEGGGQQADGRPAATARSELVPVLRHRPGLEGGRGTEERHSPCSKCRQPFDVLARITSGLCSYVVGERGTAERERESSSSSSIGKGRLFLRYNGAFRAHACCCPTELREQHLKEH